VPFLTSLSRATDRDEASLKGREAPAAERESSRAGAPGGPAGGGGTRLGQRPHA